MELSDIVLVLAFVAIISAITGGVVRNIMRDIKDLEHNMKQQLIGLKLQESKL